MTILSESLKLYCRVHNVGTRYLAKEWGTTHTTVARFLNGKPVEQDLFLRILVWITDERLATLNSQQDNAQ